MPTDESILPPWSDAVAVQHDGVVTIQTPAMSNKDDKWKYFCMIVGVLAVKAAQHFSVPLWSLLQNIFLAINLIGLPFSSETCSHDIQNCFEKPLVEITLSKPINPPARGSRIFF